MGVDGRKFFICFKRTHCARAFEIAGYAEIIANFYLDTVSGVEGCPVKLRTDCGTENGIMAAMQCTLREDIEAHKYGTFPANLA